MKSLLTNSYGGPMMNLMNTTNATRRIDSTLPAPTAKQRRALVSTGQRIVTEAVELPAAVRIWTAMTGAERVACAQASGVDKAVPAFRSNGRPYLVTDKRDQRRMAHISRFIAANLATYGKVIGL
jgi:hypothetical protein